MAGANFRVGYTNDREPENFYMSLVHYNNLDEGSVPPFVTGKNVNYISESVITAPHMTENQDNNDQTISESDEYIELHGSESPA